MAEKKPIMRLYFAKLKEAWYEQSEEEMMEFMRKDQENLNALGCTFTTYDLRWSTEKWQFVGVEEWPNIEALEKRGKFEKEEAQLFRYVESKTYVGTRVIEEYGKE